MVILFDRHTVWCGHDLDDLDPDADGDRSDPLLQRTCLTASQPYCVCVCGHDHNDRDPDGDGVADGDGSHLQRTCLTASQPYCVWRKTTAPTLPPKSTNKITMKLEVKQHHEM